IDAGEKALAFSSGMAAGTALLQALPAGAHVLLPDDSYYSFRAIASEYFKKWTMTFDVIAMESVDTVRRAMRPETKLVWMESPSNPLMKIVDIRAVAQLARERGAMSLVDGTFATPALQRPIELGS